MRRGSGGGRRGASGGRRRVAPEEGRPEPSGGACGSGAGGGPRGSGTGDGATDDGVRVEAPARLHLGLLDLRGDLGRRFGGLGAALGSPRVVLEARPAARLVVGGPSAERARRFAERFLRARGLQGGARIAVREAIPPHSGLGSGTQLALAVGRALARLHGVDLPPEAIAEATGRGRRSGVGTWLFARGGFVVEGGHRAGETGAPPLLFHRPLPASWRCVLVLPDVPRGLSGDAERAAFAGLRPPSAARMGALARLVLVAALPALVEEDLAAFGEAITRIQRLVGDCFREPQGGRFAHPEVERLVRRLRRAGAAGVGQSSWGPAVFALAGGEEEGERLAATARRAAGDGRVAIVPFDAVGGTCAPLRAGEAGPRPAGSGSARSGRPSSGPGGAP